MDQSLERKFLIHVIKNVESASLSKQRGVDGDFFQWKTAGKLYALNIWFTEQYNTLLTSTELAGLLKQSSTIPEDLQQSITVLFNELQLESLDTDINFLIDQIFSYHKQALVENALRRSVETLADKKIDRAVTTLKNDLAKIDQKFRTEIIRSGPLDVDATQLIYDFHDREAHPEKYEGVKLGFSDVDRAMGGLQKGTFGLFMGAYKSLKSALMLNIAINVAKSGKQVLIHCNEGNRNFWHQRLAAKELQIPNNHIINGTMTPDEKNRWLDFYHKIEQKQLPFVSNIYFDEVPLSLSTPNQVNETFKKRSDELGKNVDLIIVDYFGRLSPNHKGNMAKWEMLGVISDELSEVAINHRTTIISPAHANLEGTKDAKADGTDINPENLGLSSQPNKSVDYMFSWVLENHEEFERQGGKGFGRLALKLSRHSATAAATLMVDAKYMDIREITVGGTGNTTP